MKRADSGEQLIELWETFLMQLDADEDGEPFFKPQQINAEPTASSKPKAKREGDAKEEPQQPPGSENEGTRDGETAQAVAATATVKQGD